MKRRKDYTDNVGTIIRLAGHDAHNPGMNERIMNRIELARMHMPVKVKPVIGPLAWLLIGSFFVALLALCFIFAGNAEGNSKEIRVNFGLLAEQVSNMNSLFNFKVSLVLLIAMTSLLILTGLDYLMNVTQYMLPRRKPLGK
jgi:hypothetical protein